MLKIRLADNQAIFRAGIAKVLAVEDDIRIVSQSQSLDQLMLAVEKFRAAVLVCASAFQPDLSGILRAAAAAKTQVIIIAEQEEHPDSYLRAGARGVIYRNVTGPALVECVRRVVRGETWTQDSAIPIEVRENDMVGARVLDRLTPKELRIVALIVQGFKNKEIAVQLGTTEQVIKNYLRNVYDKIGVSDRLELALFTIHHRMLAEAAAATTAAPVQAAPRVV